MKKIKIGLFGFGVVGEGLYNIISNTPESDYEIVKICVKDKSKVRNAPQELFTFNKELLLFDPTIDVIVELIDNAEEAKEIVCSALSQNKPVVSANKKMIAENFILLREYQKQTKTPLLYEAAVCASIPIIRNLEDYFSKSEFNGLEGIVNGSTNYILDKIQESNADYASVLTEAQAEGFAESDPKLDVEGYDASFKLSILAAHGFGVVSPPENILTSGITRLNEFSFDYAKQWNSKIKLVARITKTINDNVSISVLPTLVNDKSPLFNVNREFNGIVIDNELSDEHFLRGKGAGAFATASAVLADIDSLFSPFHYGYGKFREEGTSQKQSDDNFEVSIIASSKETDFLEISKSFVEVTRLGKNEFWNFVIGRVNSKELRPGGKLDLPSVSVVQLN